MIKASELRQGNILSYSGKEIVIDIEILYSLFVDGSLIPDKLSPIILTPEWLERCGATKCKGTPFYEIDMLSNIGQIHINPNNGMIWLRHHRNETTAINPHSETQYYLHQLQNLYFALTGNELSINL